MNTPASRDALRRRLRRLGVVRGFSQLPPSPRRAVAIESLVAGRFHTTAYGQCFVAERRFPLDHTHGCAALGHFLHLPPATLAVIGQAPAMDGGNLARAVFLDTETTGLSAGSGTMAFLVGMGFFDGDAFCLLQVFLRDPGDERAMVDLLEEMTPRFAAVVTFNGRSFDLPLLEARFVLARRPFLLAAAPHLDLLGPARRLWRDSLPSCALSALERAVLGVQRDQADVPSGDIPRIYRDYLATGDAREISRIFYHNQVDILSLVTLAVRLGQAFSEPTAELGGAELFALARWHRETGGDVEGELRAALAAGLPADLRLRAMRELASWLKRDGRRAEAFQWWQQLAIEDPWDISAAVELAKTFEWHLNRPALAAAWTRLALGRASRRSPSPQRERELAELRHRLARLERRLDHREEDEAG